MPWKKVDDFSGSIYKWEDGPSLAGIIGGGFILFLIFAAMANGCS